MKIPVGKILRWIGQAIATAAVTEAADRITRPRAPRPRDEQTGEE